ncbi:MAG TPA: leucine--tRNA ligase [Gemmatimonadaceae bacterium]|jgi:leucyl-tRNA synthetase|nr:leucine--tRNA ligase [Gemmatimonadaceae bacterium]
MDNSATRDDPLSPAVIAYNPQAIEQKWQRIWQQRGTNHTDLQRAQRPFYALMMFPYPSAEGLHVGNLFAFTGNDIYGRFQRLMGHNVFEPLGYDAFGIHSENYALKVGVHPMDLIPRNIANFQRQLESAGLMVDWRYRLATTDPNYYKWTQWLFLQLFNQGLAYRKQAAVNWCPDCKTVLANEQVVGGLCERSQTPVEQRLLEQWFFRISDYAPRLLENLDHIDWSETTKTAQRNWIGRSEGAEIEFESRKLDGGACEIRVFTTRPDTIYGATYMVLAPEHPLVQSLTKPKQKKEVEQYRERTKKQDLVARKTSTEKTGVFTGSYAINPATEKEIPIWISDYVLMEYGTGAIMGVPGHDQRDFDFARKFELPIVRVVCGERENANTPLSEAFEQCEAGTLVNSGVFDGYEVEAAKKAIVELLSKAGSAKPVVHFRLHDWCISRQRYWGPPIPIIYCDDCGVVPVPEKDLPVVLPFIEDFKPDDSGVSPLARHEEFYRVACPKCGKTGRRETDVSDNFLDNSWYFLRYPSVGRDDVPFDPVVTKKWLPVTSYIGGNEHAVLHLLYSRFITMVLHDAGRLEFEEPFTRFRAHGHIIREGAKMSKTQGNIVNPDEYIENWGADAFRTYLMFLGPYEQGGDFRDASISGARRFLDRLFASVQTMSSEGSPDQSVMRKLHQTIRKLSEDIPRLSYNTAVAAMMEYINVVRKGERTPQRDEVLPLITLVAPFAPHLAEELWEQTGGTGSVFDSAWPSFDPNLAKEDTIELVVQVNGKVRGRVHVSPDITESAALAAALGDPVVAKFVGGTAKKVIFVPGRLLNIVA